jgi:hypothetical protein
MTEWSELREIYQQKTARIEQRSRRQLEIVEAQQLYAAWADAALTDVIVKVHAELSRFGADIPSCTASKLDLAPPRLVHLPDGQRLRVVCISHGPHSVQVYGQWRVGQVPALHLLRLRQVKAKPDAVVSLAGVWLARQQDGAVSLRGYAPSEEELSVADFAQRAVRLLLSSLS